MDRCIVGCAGWALPAAQREAFAGGDSVLARYASRFAGVEINSSFYRSHRPATYARWAASVPTDFRFSVKLPRAITHDRRLDGCDDLLADFLSQVCELGEKLGCLLAQLPPSLAWDLRRADTFFASLRARHQGPIAVEPRHASWFSDDALASLQTHGIARVNADPSPCERAAWPLASSATTVYYRLHGSPRMYYSDYDDAYLSALAERMSADARHADAVWCIFDNTAAGAATGNALTLLDMLSCGQINKHVRTG